MTIRRATTRDIPRVQRAYEGTPNGPLYTVSQVQEFIDLPTVFLYVDTSQDVVVNVTLDMERSEVNVVAWIWSGAFLIANHGPVLGTTLRAVKGARPVTGGWQTWGQFPGAGSTDAERLADSQRQAREHRAWFSGLTDAESRHTDKQWEGRGFRLDAVLVALTAAGV